jgi:putative ribosome biogenesis GTPase RsgA
MSIEQQESKGTRHREGKGREHQISIFLGEKGIGKSSSVTDD